MCDMISTLNNTIHGKKLGNQYDKDKRETENLLGTQTLKRNGTRMVNKPEKMLYFTSCQRKCKLKPQ